jgi:hypothetical protein
MMKPSDSWKQTHIYQEDEMLRAIHERYSQWPIKDFTPEQVSFDIGYLIGLIVRMERHEVD